MTPLRAAAVLAIGLSLATGVARADDQAKAVALFDDGQRAMKAKQYEHACKSFAASLALVSDSGTKGSLARCYTELGKLVSAWVLWRELSDTAPTPQLRADAGARAKKLEARLPRYTIKVVAPTPGMTVTVNGKPVDLGVEVAAPIDPGPLSVTARAAGYTDWTRDETATEGKALVIEVPALARPTVDPGPTRPVVTTGAIDNRRRNRHLLGASIAGVGAVSAIAGGVFGFRARGQYQDAKDTCGGSIDTCAPAQLEQAQGQVDDARSSATVSTVLIVAGGAAVITGAVLYMTAPKRESRGVTFAPVVDDRSAGFTLSGRF